LTEVIEVNKKVLVFAVALMAVAVLATPIIGTVMAGKGQEKLDFLLHMVGTTMPPPDKVWAAGVTGHVQGGNWIVTGDFYIEIGEAGAVETIPKECLSYVGKMDIMANAKQEFYVLTVRETITIYTDDTKLTERGTIEILTQGENPGGKGLIVNGHGTGEFEGVKITGLTTTTVGPPLIVDRVGIVMGWPT